MSLYENHSTQERVKPQTWFEEVALTTMFSLVGTGRHTMLDKAPAMSRLIGPTAKAQSSLRDSKHIGGSI